ATTSSEPSFRCARSVLPPCLSGGHPRTALSSVSVPLLAYSSTRRKRPHGACRIFLKPRTGPGTRCDFGQNGQTKRVPSALGIRSTITAQPGLHSLYSTGSGGATSLAAGLTTGFIAARWTARFTGRVRRPAVRVDRVARIFSPPQPVLPSQARNRIVARLTLGALPSAAISNQQSVISSKQNLSNQ